jgi:hypothetical protein
VLVSRRACLLLALDGLAGVPDLVTGLLGSLRVGSGRSQEVAEWSVSGLRKERQRVRGLTPPTAPSFSNCDPTAPSALEEKVPPTSSYQNIDQPKRSLPPNVLPRMVIEGRDDNDSPFSPSLPISPSDLNLPPTLPALSPVASPAEKVLAALFKASPTVSERAAYKV